MTERSRIWIGTAGWAIPRAVAEAFPTDSAGLTRYAGVFRAAEINTTFYRPHKPATFEGWRARTPDGFRFAVKLPKAITHEARLVESAELLQVFSDSVAGLAEKLGPLLVQLPPSLKFDREAAERFFKDLRAVWIGPAAIEPRHVSWFEPEAEAKLRDFQIARVAADPPRHAEDGRPGGHAGLAYWRVHGSPRVYFTPYEEPALRTLADALLASPAEEAWCVFDNTASGAAAANALRLKELLGS